MKFNLIETLLLEDIAAVKKQFSHIPENDFDKIIRQDPTFDEKRDSVGKYGKWLLGLYNKDKENLFKEGVPEIISMYDDIKNDRSKKVEKDIGKFKSIKDMFNAAQNAEDAELTDRQKLRARQKNKDYDLVWQNNAWAIFVPNTWEADVNLGKGTNWCTADSREEVGKKYYDQYLQQGGKYYIIMNKQNRDEKYQFHFESNQFMDAYDDSINPKDLCLQIDDNVEGAPKSVIQFFASEGYDIDDFGEFEPDFDEIVEQIMGGAPHNGVEYIEQINPGDLYPIDENWYSVGWCADFVDGYWDAIEIKENIEQYEEALAGNLIVNIENNSKYVLNPELSLDEDTVNDIITDGYCAWLEKRYGDFYLSDLLDFSDKPMFEVGKDAFYIKVNDARLVDSVSNFFAYEEFDAGMTNEIIAEGFVENIVNDEYEITSDDSVNLILWYYGKEDLDCPIDLSEILIEDIPNLYIQSHITELITLINQKSTMPIFIKKES